MLHLFLTYVLVICYTIFFKFKNEANIARLLCIIEMETSPQKRQQRTLINTIEDIGNQSHVEGREKFGNEI
jgi:hypothetical protein